MLDELHSRQEQQPRGDRRTQDAGGHRPARWSTDDVAALFDLPFADLLFRAQQVHRAHHAPNAVQLSTLLSVKTGGCPEDCAYCPQAARHHAGVAAEAMLGLVAGQRAVGVDGVDELDGYQVEILVTESRRLIDQHQSPKATRAARTPGRPRSSFVETAPCVTPCAHLCELASTTPLLGRGRRLPIFPS